MRRLKPNLPVVLVLIFTSILGGELWWLRRERHAAERGWQKLAEKRVEFDALARRTPALTPENEEAIAVELAEATVNLGKLRASLAGANSRWLDAIPPAKPLDAFFDLAGFVDEARRAAAANGISVSPDEHFGFDAYATEGPAPEILPWVYRQRLAAQRVADALIEARPAALIGFQIEAPAKASDAHRDRGAGSFSLAPALSLRLPGQVDGVAFKIEFSGYTAALRALLNRLAGLAQPFIIRSVEVEPLVSPRSPGPTAPSSAVEPSLSRFSVTVELLIPATGPAPSPL